MALVCTAETFV